MTEVFVEQPLALPGSAKNLINGLLVIKVSVAVDLKKQRQKIMLVETSALDTPKDTKIG